MAPLALIAYPEAYEELRRTVLLLVVNEGEGLFGCTDELWLKETSTLVAGMFSRTIRQAAGRSKSADSTPLPLQTISCGIRPLTLRDKPAITTPGDC